MNTHPTPTPDVSSRAAADLATRARRPVWTLDQVRTLGVTTTLATAASILGISRSQAYRLAVTDTFPAPTFRAGRRVIVPVAGLLRLLLGDEPECAPTPAGRRLDLLPEPSVDATTTPPADYARHRWRHRHAEHPGDDE